MIIHSGKSYRTKGCEWAMIDVAVSGPESVRVMIHSSYGSWTYYWCSTGLNPFDFLNWKESDRQYTMTKFMGRGYMVFDVGTAIDDIQKTICRVRREDPDNRSAEDARELYDWIANQTDATDQSLFTHLVYGSPYFENFFGPDSYDYIPRGEVPGPMAVHFWKDFRGPFAAEMQRQSKRWAWIFPIWKWTRDIRDAHRRAVRKRKAA